MENIRNSGIAHLFAISGLHLSFIAGLFFSLSRNLLVFSRRMAENYNIKKNICCYSCYSEFNIFVALLECQFLLNVHLL